MNCKQCGAPVPGALDNCPFCGALTESAKAHQEAKNQAQLAQEVAAAEREAQRKAAHAARDDRREEQRHLRGLAAVERASNHALWWSLGGALFCVFPIGAVVAVVLGIRAKRLARELSVPSPARATVGLSIGVTTLVGMAVLTAWFISDTQDMEAHKAELKAELSEAAKRAELDEDLACKVIELYLLGQGHDSVSPIGIGDVECAGELTQEGEAATFEGVRFARRTCKAELGYGSRWRVRELSGPDCYPKREAAAQEAKSKSKPEPEPEAQE